MVESDTMAGGGARMRVPRSRGALSGVLLLLLGAWGALIPFIGPYFDFGYTPDSTWTWTSGRFWYEVLPGAVTALGALLLLFSANRLVTIFGAWIAALSGAWFIVGPVMAARLDIGSTGSPIDKGWVGTFESLGLYFGLGAIILFLAATSLGRLSVRSVRDVRADERRRERDARATEEARRDAMSAPVTTAPATTARSDDRLVDSREGEPTRATTAADSRTVSLPRDDERLEGSTERISDGEHVEPGAVPRHRA